MHYLACQVGNRGGTPAPLLSTPPAPAPNSRDPRPWTCVIRHIVVPPKTVTLGAAQGNLAVVTLDSCVTADTTGNAYTAPLLESSFCVPYAFLVMLEPSVEAVRVVCHWRISGTDNTATPGTGWCGLCGWCGAGRCRCGAGRCRCGAGKCRCGPGRHWCGADRSGRHLCGSGGSWCRAGRRCCRAGRGVNSLFIQSSGY